MRRLLAVGLVVVLLVGAVPAAAFAGGPSASSPTAEPQRLGVGDDFDDVTFHITVYGNGTAKWTFTYQQTLNETEKDEFEAFAEEFNNNSTALYDGFRGQAKDLASAGQNRTNRTMDAERFSKEARVGGIVNENRGIVQMSFHWTSFAVADGADVVIGDVFQDGLYLGPNQSLVVHAGPELRFTAVDPNATVSDGTLAQSESVTWEGRRDFNDERPRVRFEPVPVTTTAAETTRSGGAAGPNATTTAVAQQPGETGSPLALFVAAVVVLLGLAAAFAWRQGDFGSFADRGDDPGGTAGSAAANPDSGSPAPSVSDEELLTDEARVKKLLDENGGRMKQVNIVDETGWSKSKVSMLLSEMEEDGEISKLRVGRENIISLEGHEPDAAGSPLEE
ncbi:helix-turn-helix transcriptional regulator [Halorussus marinus]|uniref:helix-turn-helix transcriptional regulator n=1 Tax=Halorussus marinus TaxID=2505976 RepID=UPI00106E9AFC|nr:hypothetical protein [Halorussus marinus]